MKFVVTHASPDLDAITSVWLIKRFLPGWEDAKVTFVPAGERLEGAVAGSDPIEQVGSDEVIHVDTGLGPLDHHQTDSQQVCAASLTWDYVKAEDPAFSEGSSGKSERMKLKQQAIDRMVKVVVDIDHFKEVFWAEPNADYHEFGLFGIIEGLKLGKPNQDGLYVDFVIEALDALLHNFENKLWAEKEISENGIQFSTKFGKGIGFETINDSVLKVAQKMGYVVVVRKDPRKGYVRIKALPDAIQSSELRMKNEQKIKTGVDLTKAYEILKEKDPQATWFLHVSKKMLLNGTTKNPKMRPTKLALGEIINIIKSLK